MQIVKIELGEVCLAKVVTFSLVPKMGLQAVIFSLIKDQMINLHFVSTNKISSTQGTLYDSACFHRQSWVGVS